MTPAKLSRIAIFLLPCCLTAPWVSGQMPGFAGRGHLAARPPQTTQLPLHATRQGEFAIPFSIDSRVSQPVEVHLYVSTDQGRNWQLHARQRPSAGHFVFRAAADGEYWFASRTLDGTPRNQSRAAPRPELRVVVDTVSPQLELSARATGGSDVLISWQAFDQNLQISSFKVEYQEEVGGPWKPIPVRLPDEGVIRTSYQGQTTWTPATRAPRVNLRAEVRDRAGNLGVANRRFLMPAHIAFQAAKSGLAEGPPADPLSGHVQSDTGAVPWPSDNQPRHSGGGTPLPGQQDQPAGNYAATLPYPGPRGVPPPELNQPGGGGSSRSVRPFPAERATASVSQSASPLRSRPDGESSESQSPEPHVAAQQASTQSSSEADASAPELAWPTIDGNEPVATASSGPDETAGSLPGDAAMPEALSNSLSSGNDHVVPPAERVHSSSEDVINNLPPGERPQMTNSRRFQLEYDVAAIGPSGIAEVQLWATPDAGRTWRLWGTDKDLRSPFDVSVEKDGIFGFRVVVVGNNGMSGRRPRSGDPADVWIGIDGESPRAKLTGAVYGEGSNAGKLMIRWQASDPHLGPRPVTLFYGESPNGPWTTIVSALPNTGEFAWPAGPELPPDVYLKLEVRDQAGNVAAAQTERPVRIDGLAPKAHIRGIQPMPNLDREAFRVPRQHW